jgi:hypothetical protein
MLLGMGLAARPALAQLQVTITGSGGASVAGAQVELWHGATRIAVRVADRAGRARFSADEAGEATVVQVRRIGFAPMRTSRPPEARELVMVLEPLARALPRVRVASQQSRCPQREDPDARSAWESSRQRYDDTSSLGRAAILEYSAGEVGQDSIGLIDPEHLLGGVRGSNRPAIRGLRQDVAEHGYAWMLPPRHYYEARRRVGGRGGRLLDRRSIPRFTRAHGCQWPFLAEAAERTLLPALPAICAMGSCRWRYTTEVGRPAVIPSGGGSGTAAESPGWPDWSTQYICITLHPMPDQTSFRLPKDLLRALTRAARERGVPKSQLVREALQAYLAGPSTPPGEAWERVSHFVGSVSLDPAAIEKGELSRQIRRHNWRD